MKVSNAWGVPNQFLIVEKGEGWNGNFIKKEVFQSYDSIIAEVVYWRREDIEGIPNAREVEVTLDEQYWDYSQTTGKYRNKFLGEEKKDTLKKIEDGTYKLAKLNK